MEGRAIARPYGMSKRRLGWRSVNTSTGPRNLSGCAYFKQPLALPRES